MKKLVCTLLFVFLGIHGMKANICGPIIELYNVQEPSRNTELDKYWAEVSRTVREGDFEGYKATYHKDAVVVFAVGENKTTVAVSKALENWEQGFIDTKAGKKHDNVEFRFSQRIGGETTAHDTGIFHFTSKDANGKLTTDVYINFEMLFVKQKGKWLGLMENQKSVATRADWEVLQ